MLILGGSCKQLYSPLEAEEEVTRKPVARVNDIYLYADDIEGLTLNSMTSQDSLQIVQKYIDSWVRKQLTISRASKEIDFDEANIERKVLDYRYALMVHEFEKYYVNQRLDKKISEAEIREYYDDKFENFVLRQNIIRCLYAVVPAEAPQIDNFRKLVRGYPKTDLEEIQSYCYRFAAQSSLETDLWINFDEVIAGTPFANVQDKVTFLKNNSYVESSDETNYYFIRLLDYKISNQISPLEYIHDDIESILINKKKVDLRKQLEEDLLENAKENNEFEIY
ncbi:peptidyl-prolyl cis-trans isomerase [Reichenbachiella agarivorans]|uniref:Peptidyl-prolyl cis-trans isomerase n=1 Tax=Reichenbachiella agarivorans TaxID=2979464 RepID=A0ABY6CRW4_9BACT|nr:peptidyl-prolyl cis-trans isomerase [Reichenbachiella agarivorans]UXP33241.1 peptidyl-prolyl cis-trans isomerase [Reichenbachiella agarivorans]